MGGGSHSLMQMDGIFSIVLTWDGMGRMGDEIGKNIQVDKSCDMVCFVL